MLVVLMACAVQADDKELPKRVDDPVNGDIVSASNLSRILLRPRDIELSIGLSYEKRDTAAALRLERLRQFSIPMSISVGMSERITFFLATPLSYRQNELLSIDDTGDNVSYGIGDLRTGIDIQLKAESDSTPYVGAYISATLPTGRNLKASNDDESTYSAETTGLSAGLTFSKAVDPLVLNLAISIDKNHYRSSLDSAFQQGDRFNYSLGYGFAVNSLITLSGQLEGSYQKQGRIENDPIPGSSSEPLSIDLRMTYRLSPTYRIVANVNFGVNPDASDASFGMNYIWNIKR